jgi:Trypsin-like peptidase domain
MQTENCQFDFNRRKQRKQGTLLPLRPPVLLILFLCISSISNALSAQCYVDPVTNEQICTPVSSSAHCRMTVGDGSTGSGTLVRRSESLGLVLTCAHLFDSASGRIIVTFTNGQRFAARLVERDRAHDLAALLIRRPDVEPITVSDEEPGGVLAACGYGPDGQLRCFRGNVTGQATAAGAVYPSLTIAGAARPGDSGGGVLNTADQLVGVVWGQRDGLTYATCGRPVRVFLDRILGRADRQPPRAPGNRFSRVPGRPGVQSPNQSEPPTSHDIDPRIHARLQSLDDRLKQIGSSKVGFFQGLSFGKLLVGALGLSGPVAAAVVIAGGLAGRRLRKHGATRRVPGMERGSRSGLHAPDSMLPASHPIPVDTPPPRQRTVPETHYVSVEKDSFAKAHQWACEQVARKYPGATEILQALDSLIKQHLAAQ